jgi:hypothetical protein
MPDISSPHIVTALSALLGALIGGLVSIAVVCINRRFDDRRHLRELAMNGAIQYWIRNAEFAIQQAHVTGKDQDIVPLDTTIIHMLLLAELLSQKRITKENVVDEITRIRRISDIAADATKPKQNDHQKPAHKDS